MSFELVIFTTPTDGQGILRLDSGVMLNSHPAVFQNRKGIGFTCAPETANGNGAELILFAPNRLTISQRGILWLRVNNDYYPWIDNQQAAFVPDDFRIPALPVIPPVTIPPPVNPPVISDETPIAIINRVYASKQWDLSTKEGSGLFTEACCTELHNVHSSSWGHVKKHGQQNQYNGHAVDAIMLKNSMPDCDKAIYDIIVNSESPNAVPALNFSSPVDESLWYYPA